MKKLLVVALLVWSSIPAFAAMPRQLGMGTYAGFEDDGTGYWVYNVQKGEGWKIRNASVSGSYSTIGVTQGSNSIQLVDSDGAWAQQTIGIGLWRFWDELKVSGTKITMDITLNNPGGNSTIPDQWFEVDVAVSGALNGWGDNCSCKTNP